MRLLGIDHGTVKAGIALIEGSSFSPTVTHHEQISLGKGDLGARLHYLRETIWTLIVLKDVTVCAIEVPITYAGRVAGTAARGQGYGVIHELCHTLSIPIVDVRPNEGKKALSGRGNANKVAMIAAALYLLGVACKEDESDAIGIGLAGWRKYHGLLPTTDN